MNILLSLYCTWTGRIGFNFVAGAFGIILSRHQNQSGAKPEVFFIVGPTGMQGLFGVESGEV